MNERDIFVSALEIDDPEARRAHLQSACGDDPDLLRRVESLLASHEANSRFLETPVGKQLEQPPRQGPAATIVIGKDSTRDGPSDADNSLLHGNGPMPQNQDNPADEIPLGFFQPPTRPGSLGRLSHYEVLEVLGRGAFGTVLKAFDDKLQRVVAIKVMTPELAATSPARKRFLREARASAAIRHEYVVSVYAVEETPIPYLVMEYVPGQTLQQRLDERGPLEVPEVLRLGTQIAEALAAAHAKDLIHRDIKPGNILLETGIHERVKITDFGLARAADDASMTQSGMIAGTPMYMAPEQALGHKLDQRADLFSFGSVLYQMVSGRPPFRAPTTLAVLKRVTEETPRPISEIIPETPAWLCDIISKLHAKSPDDRYQSAREIADVLANCEAQLKAHSELKEFSLIPRTKSRRMGAWKWVAAAALVLPLMAYGAYTLSHRPQPEVVNVQSVNASVPGSQGPMAERETDSGWHGWPADAPPPAVAPFDATKAKEHQSAWAKHLGVPVEITNSIGMTLIYCPPGTFRMGSPGDEKDRSNTEAQVSVTISKGFYLGKYSVTQAEFKAVMGTSPWAGKTCVKEGDNYPATYINWDDAAKFCRKLTARESQAGRLPQGYLYVLPTEAQREYACRAGTTTAYSFGGDAHDLGEYAWWGWLGNGNCKREQYAHRVGQKKANPWGFCDLHGNVCEWCLDYYADKLPGGTDPLVEASGSDQLFRGGDWASSSDYVLRGGDWYNPAERCRSAARIRGVSGYRDNDLGVRVALVLADTAAERAKISGTTDAAQPSNDSIASKPSPAVTNPDAQSQLRLPAVGSLVGADGKWKLPLGAPAPAIAPFDGKKAKEHQEGWAKHLGVPVEMTNSIGMKMVLIPPGEFTMGEGADAPRGSETKTFPGASMAVVVVSSADAHKVRITKPFYLGKYVVTQEEWEAVMGQAENRSQFKGPKNPVEQVTWEDCQIFLKRLNQKAAAARGTYRLPTEAQWEYACRAGSAGRWCYGDSESALHDYAWYAMNSARESHPVGQKKPNRWGLYDMHGNVWEWCADWFDGGYYLDSPTDDPTGAKTGFAHVIRGGGWATYASWCHCASHQADEPGQHKNNLGFRVSLVLPDK